MAEKKLYRSRNNRVIAGVAGGLGEYLDIDPTLIRLVLVILLFSGVGIPAYIVAWFIIPEEPIVGQSTKETKTEQIGSDFPGEKQFEKTAEEMEKLFTGKSNTSSERIIGLILLLVGLVFLLSNLIPRLFNLAIFWPLVLIVAGVWIVGNGNRRKDQ